MIVMSDILTKKSMSEEHYKTFITETLCNLERNGINCNYIYLQTLIIKSDSRCAVPFHPCLRNGTRNKGESRDP